MSIGLILLIILVIFLLGGFSGFGGGPGYGFGHGVNGGLGLVLVIILILVLLGKLQAAMRRMAYAYLASSPACRGRCRSFGLNTKFRSVAITGVACLVVPREPLRAACGRGPCDPAGRQAPSG